MFRRHTLALFAGLFLLLGAADLSAQAFFPSQTKGTFQVRFTSNAAGVQVAIDGQLAGVIPLTVWVLPGVHQFSFTVPGEATKTVPYQVKGDTEVPYMVSQRFFPLTVNTNVPGASLAVDGTAFPGNTTSISAGAHTLTVSAPGYQAVSLPFQQPASPNTINVTLVAATFPLTVNTNVPGATLAVDGTAFPGNTTSISVGAHTLTVSAPGYQAVNLPFQQPASPNTINVTLVAATFPLTVNTNVPGATLAVDGKAFTGNTTSVSVGAHTLTVTAPGYQAASLPFQQPASPNTINVTLVGIPATVTLVVDKLFRNSNAYKVYVDNAEAKGPVLSLTPGSHQIRLTFGVFSVETTVSVTAGQALTLEPNVVWQMK